MKFEIRGLLQKLQNEPKPFFEFLRKGNFSLEIYKPEKVDLQMPHHQDEVYVIASGSGMFQDGDENYTFETGDLIFVPAYKEHRFYNFTDDFSTLVIFV